MTAAQRLRELSNYYLQDECDADLNDLLTFAALNKELLDKLEAIAGINYCDECHRHSDCSQIQSHQGIEYLLDVLEE